MSGASEIGWEGNTVVQPQTLSRSSELEPGQFRPGDRAGDVRHETPNLMWPDDRSWFLASEIDLDSTLIGGPRGLVDDLLQDEWIEAIAVEPIDPIDKNSDRVNR